MTVQLNGVSAEAITGAVWRKSARSNAAGNCVEVARLEGEKLPCATPASPQGRRWSTPRPRWNRFSSA